MSEYSVYLNDALVAKSNWLPHAQAAWHRATRDTYTAERSGGGEVRLVIDDELVATARTRGRIPTPWPVREQHETNLRDLAHAVLVLARAAGVSAEDIAEELQRTGLAMTPSRLQSISTLEKGRRSDTTAAELVSICYAAVGVLKNSAQE